MNNYPEYAEVNGRTYKINTDFRYAIECNKVIEDITLGHLEKSLAIICILFGGEALDHQEDLEELMKISMKFLYCGRKPPKDKDFKKDMDFVEDMDYIEASFMSDYHIDLAQTELHWWKFVNLLNGLSNSEMGNCCVLNRIRYIRNFDLSTIKNPKERSKMAKTKEQVALKSNKPKATLKEQENARRFYQELLGKE